MMFLALYRVLKSMEQLFFDSLAETDVVRRFPMSAKVLVLTSPENWTRDCIGVPLPVSFFVLSFFPRLCFISYERINCRDWGAGFHPLYLDFFSSIFSLPCYNRVRGSALVLFLSYMNVSGTHPRPRLSSQPLTILASWVILCVRWSGWLPRVYLRGIGRLI